MPDPSKAPLGANLVDGGATFRVWAPAAKEVHIRLGPEDPSWTPSPATLLARASDGTWSGFVAGVSDGDPYLFDVIGDGGQGPKRDPRARELTVGFPRCAGVVRDPGRYHWHDSGYKAPAFNDLLIYQFHIGVFYAVDDQGHDARLSRRGTFLDVLDRLEYLVTLGVNAIEPLPVVEFETEFSLGYNGSDYYSPESRYAVDPAILGPQLVRINGLLAARGQLPMTVDQVSSQADQLRAMVDVCHVHGVAVLLDVVYNHAGGWGSGPNFDDRGLFFLDREAFGDNNRSQYFTDQGWAGGLVFAYWKDEVRQFLIDNAASFLDEYHVDGFRYDEVTVIDRFGGWRFCQDLTSTLRYLRPDAVNIAEYWQPDPSPVVRPVAEGGAGFDAVWHDGLRQAVRGAIAQASAGQGASVDMTAVRDALATPAGFSASWRAVQHLENHDIVYAPHGDRVPRIPALADGSDPRSWYARSRARVAMGLLLTAPGIPMLFMGQEFLESKSWSDSPDASTLIGWDALSTDAVKQDFLRFTSDLARLRGRSPALRGEPRDAYHVHDGNRVIAFHRWIEGEGRDVVVVASLNETTFPAYDLGFPIAGRWREVFNGDAYDNGPAVGNGGAITADGPPMHGLPASATIVIPANGFLVFMR